MKELLEKFLWVFSEGVNKLSEGNEAEAIKKFTEASEMSESLTKKAEEDKEVDLKKFLESDEGKESLKKWADLYLGDADLPGLLKQLKEGQENLTKKIEDLEKEKKEDDQVIEKALNDQGGEIDELKKTLETRVSKID